VRILQRTVETSGYAVAKDERPRLDESIRNQFTITPMSTAAAACVRERNIARSGIAPGGRAQLVAFHHAPFRTLPRQNSYSSARLFPG
jgi:hypothetical protein